MKTLEGGWDVVISAYKFTIFEIWRDIIRKERCELYTGIYSYTPISRNIYCVSVLSLHQSLPTQIQLTVFSASVVH